MSNTNVVRAWKDPSYRGSLDAEELALMPAHPAGLVELSDEELREASGLTGLAVTTHITCTESTLRRFRCCP